MNNHTTSLVHAAKQLCRTITPTIGALAQQIRDNGALAGSYKAARDLVTEADLQVEKLIKDTIRNAFPDHRFLAEESAASWEPGLHQGPLWVIDPIDGTVNFSRGLAHWATSIALTIDGTVQYGIVHAPDLGVTFEASRGGGATRNGKLITCRTPSSLQDVLVATGFPYKRDTVSELSSRVERVLSSCADLRRFGAASLDCCLVAAGMLDAYFEDVAPWDIAAGGLIVREAGGMTGNYRTVDPNGLPPDLASNGFLATGKGIFPEMQRLLR